MDCLKDQIQRLKNLLIVPVGCVPPCVFLYGHPGTGKTAALSQVLSEFPGRHALVSGVECYTPALLYRLLLSQLSGLEQKCDGVGSFVSSLQDISDEQPEQNIAIVVEGAERVRDLEGGNALAGLMRLQELSRRPVCVILTSCLVWDKFQTSAGLPRPLFVHFPQHSRGLLLELLAQDRPAGVTDQFYRRYLSLLLAVFVSACRSLRELRYQARANFGRYQAPVLSGAVAEEDARRLWRAVEPQLRTALSTVYMREASSEQWERLQKQMPTAETESTAEVSVMADHRRLTTELPFYSKFLLIAAFLASYNPARTDRRFFVKKTGRGAGRLKPRAAAAARATALLTGPRPFPLDRLLAIFHVIVEDRVTPTAGIYSQVASLVTLRLLARRGGADKLDSPRYTCLVSLDTVRAVARTVQFEVERYLFDYV